MWAFSLWKAETLVCQEMLCYQIVFLSVIFYTKEDYIQYSGYLIHMLHYNTKTTLRTFLKIYIRDRWENGASTGNLWARENCG